MDGTMSMSLAAAADNCSRVVFVGNIPFHASEKELRDACELIGPIRSLRLAADPATGKRKGNAFVEYPDDETARSACRNLNGHHLRSRELRVNLAGRRRRRPRGDNEPVSLEDAIHAASLVSGTPPLDSVTRYLAARSVRELREIAAALEADGPDTLRLLKENVPGLAAVMEQVGHLLDMAAADDAAEAAKNKKRAAEAESNDDHRAKLTKVEVEDGSFKDKIAVSAVGVKCF
ncbi:cleavage stimulating factor 64-like [Panicum miliaceum]|uniref:Cleavage stimulating factor 64-like n=1 Tax=Panicum miliaceum TaxID=4540 RepID=A0A3L6S359_PANMI|nr:cleavage stimulating factor 64-like [Panicum miliaceum]